MKIYTKTGDAGTTGLFGGPRVGKDDLRIGAYGTIDELNAVIGMVRASGPATTMANEMANEMAGILQQIQSALFSIGAELATPSPQEHGLKWQGESEVTSLEHCIDRHDAQLSPLRTFILPGGSELAALLHLARTVCRRAEREVVRLSHQEGVSDPAWIIIYLNRLSDLLFVLARWANHQAGIPDVPWQSSRKA
jgi:cob(I)alamin adenosyltransferase